MIDYIALILVAILATYRLTFLIVFDEGPGNLIEQFRDWLGVNDLGDDKLPKTWHGKLFGCPYCIGIYVACFFAVSVTFATLIMIQSCWVWLLFPMTWFAIAGGQTVFQKWTERE